MGKTAHHARRGFGAAFQQQGRAIARKEDGSGVSPRELQCRFGADAQNARAAARAHRQRAALRGDRAVIDDRATGVDAAIAGNGEARIHRHGADRRTAQGAHLKHRGGIHSHRAGAQPGQCNPA